MVGDGATSDPHGSESLFPVLPSELKFWLSDDLGTRYCIDRLTVVGREPGTGSEFAGAASLVLADETRSISRSHAILNVVDGELKVKDLGSANGTLVGKGSEVTGSEVAGVDAAEWCPVVVGDRIFIAHRWLRVEESIGEGNEVFSAAEINSIPPPSIPPPLPDSGDFVSPETRSFDVPATPEPDDRGSSADIGSPVEAVSTISGEQDPVADVSPRGHCPTCHGDVADDDLFCGTCGSSLDSSPVAVPEPPDLPGRSDLRCPGCQQDVADDDSFCGSCGTPIRNTGESNPSTSHASTPIGNTSESNPSTVKTNPVAAMAATPALWAGVGVIIILVVGLLIVVPRLGNDGGFGPGNDISAELVANPSRKYSADIGDGGLSNVSFTGSVDNLFALVETLEGGYLTHQFDGKGDTVSTERYEIDTANALWTDSGLILLKTDGRGFEISLVNPTDGEEIWSNSIRDYRNFFEYSGKFYLVEDEQIQVFDLKTGELLANERVANPLWMEPSLKWSNNFIATDNNEAVALGPTLEEIAEPVPFRGGSAIAFNGASYLVAESEWLTLYDRQGKEIDSDRFDRRIVDLVPISSDEWLFASSADGETTVGVLRFDKELELVWDDEGQLFGYPVIVGGQQYLEVAEVVDEGTYVLEAGIYRLEDGQRVHGTSGTSQFAVNGYVALGNGLAEARSLPDEEQLFDWDSSEFSGYFVADDGYILYEYTEDGFEFEAYQ